MMPRKSTVYETNLSHPIMSKVWKKFDANKKCWKTKKRSNSGKEESGRFLSRFYQNAKISKIADVRMYANSSYSYARMSEEGVRR